jgi:hypothetical protein
MGVFSFDYVHHTSKIKVHFLKSDSMFIFRYKHRAATQWGTLVKAGSSLITRPSTAVFPFSGIKKDELLCGTRQINLMPSLSYILIWWYLTNTKENQHADFANRAETNFALTTILNSRYISFRLPPQTSVPTFLLGLQSSHMHTVDPLLAGLWSIICTFYPHDGSSPRKTLP